MLAALLLASLAALFDPSGATTTPDLSRHFTGLDATFVLLNGATGEYTHHNPPRAERRFAPCSTFKVPHTAMLLESGIVAGATGGALPYDPALQQPTQWARDFDLAGAFKASALWYYRAQAQRLGMDAEARYVRRLGYGNMDTSGGLDGPHGPFWVDGSLRISAREQVEFLQRLHDGALELAPRTVSLTREIMLVEETPRWRLYAKTGACRPPGEQTSNWYVGFVEKGAATHYFALQIGADDYGRAYAERVPATRRVLASLGILD